MSKISQTTSSFGPARLRHLMDGFGSPQNVAPAIHIAGTNGKGSTAVMAASILAEAGLRVGLYTSPHIFDPRERIKVFDGPRKRHGTAGLPDPTVGFCEDSIPATELDRILGQVSVRAREMYPKNELSYFEALTAAAYIWFSCAGCQALVIETGLGGEKDATNIIEGPKIAVITAIGRDHQALLGTSIREIASAKAGIITPRTEAVLVSSPEHDGLSPDEAEELRQVIEAKASRAVAVRWVGEEVRPSGTAESPGFQLGQGTFLHHPPLAGRHQVFNTALAILSARALWDLLDKVGQVRTDGPTAVHHPAPLSFQARAEARHHPAPASSGTQATELDDQLVSRALDGVRWPGRMTTLFDDPPMIFDGAHNIQAVTSLCQSLEELFSGRELELVFAAMADKDWRQMLDILLAPHSFRLARLVLLSSGADRALSPSTAADYAALLIDPDRNGYNTLDVAIGANVFDTIRDLRRRSCQNGRPVVICGSLYLIEAVAGAAASIAQEERQLELE